MSSGNVSSRIVRMNATQEQNFSTKKRTSGGNRKETFILLPGSNPFDRIPPSPDLRRFYYERNGFRVATAETRGSRETMEDAMLVFSPFGCHPDIHLFGVLDGHNGIGARDFLVDNFPKTFSSLLSKHSPSEALSQSFCETNTKLKEVQVPGGCTALFVLFDNNPKEQTQQIPPRPTNGETGLVNLNTADVYSSREKQKQTTFGETERKNYFQTMAGEKNNYFSNGCNVYQHDEHQADLNHTITIANAGDSRAISCIKNKVRVITKDHRPGDFSEMKRITCQGGAITTKYKQGKAITRIDTGAGFLGVSRCFGDFEVGPIIEPVPDLFKLPPLVEDELLILACDGLFDVLENEEVAQITFDLLQIDKSPGNIERACARLCDVAYHRKGKDNISVMIIQHSDTHTQTSSK
uniref:PPM-type phosphatase domain-containing protein n=1 Tax=Arcella intermedia TaxID=1963864 RepID=A0A6B2L577_9EUKA